VPGVVDRRREQRRGRADESEQRGRGGHDGTDPGPSAAAVEVGPEQPRGDDEAAHRDAGVERDVRRDEEVVATAVGVPGVVPVRAEQRHQAAGAGQQRHRARQPSFLRAHAASDTPLSRR
jgi:hypothetical protein